MGLRFLYLKRQEEAGSSLFNALPLLCYPKMATKERASSKESFYLCLVSAKDAFFVLGSPHQLFLY